MLIVSATSGTRNSAAKRQANTGNKVMSTAILQKAFSIMGSITDEPLILEARRSALEVSRGGPVYFALMGAIKASPKLHFVFNFGDTISVQGKYNRYNRKHELQTKYVTGLEKLYNNSFSPYKIKWDEGELKGELKTGTIINMVPIQEVRDRKSLTINWNADERNQYGVFIVVSALKNGQTQTIAEQRFKQVKDNGQATISDLIDAFPSCTDFYVDIYRGNFDRPQATGPWKGQLRVVQLSHSYQIVNVK